MNNRKRKWWKKISKAMRANHVRVCVLYALRGVALRTRACASCIDAGLHGFLFFIRNVRGYDDTVEYFFDEKSNACLYIISASAMSRRIAEIRRLAVACVRARAMLPFLPAF